MGVEEEKGRSRKYILAHRASIAKPTKRGVEIQDLADNRDKPQIPWPEVHPPARAVPAATSKPPAKVYNIDGI